VRVDAAVPLQLVIKLPSELIPALVEDGLIQSGLDCILPACDGEENHWHLLVEYPPKISVSVMVRINFTFIDHAPQHFLYFLPLPQGHCSLRPVFSGALKGGATPSK
ncbi:MAG: transposase, partial [Chloracidobacterium sp.]|nr:transposase [Chloracidobacterium sp.]